MQSGIGRRGGFKCNLIFDLKDVHMIVAIVNRYYLLNYFKNYLSDLNSSTRSLPRPCTISSYSIDDCNTSIVGLSSVLLLDPDQERIVYHGTHHAQQCHGQAELQHLYQPHLHTAPKGFQNEDEAHDQEHKCHAGQENNSQHAVIYHGVDETLQDLSFNHQSTNPSEELFHPQNKAINEHGILPNISFCNYEGATQETGQRNQISQTSNYEQEINYGDPGEHCGRVDHSYDFGHHHRDRAQFTKPGLAEGVAATTIYTTWAAVSTL